MYAYIDGNRAVGVGVYFCYVLFDNLRKVRIPIFQGFLIDLNDALRVHWLAASCAAAYDVLQLALADPQFVHFIPQLRDIHTVENRFQTVVDLRGHSSQLRPLRRQVGGGVVDLIGNALGLRLKVGRQQIRLELLYHERFDLIGVDVLCLAGVGPVFVAADIIARLIALAAGGGVSYVGCTASLALDQAGQQIGPLRLIGSVAFVITHSLLHLLPDFFINNSGDHPFDTDTVRIGSAACPLAEQFHPALIPCVGTHVPLIRQDGVKTILPQRPAPLAYGTGYRRQDLIVTFSCPVHLKDRSHRTGLYGIDYIVSTDNVIAQGRHTAQELSLLRLDGHAGNGLAPGLQHLPMPQPNTKQLQKEVVAVGQISKRLCRGNDLDAQHEEFFSEAEPVPNVPAPPGDVVDHHGFKLPPLRCGYHFPEAWAVHVGRGFRFIGVGGRDRDLILRAVLPDRVQLVFNAVVLLVICRVSRICCAPHNIPSFPPLRGRFFVAFCWKLWYAGFRKEISFSAASNGGRLALLTGGSFLPSDLRKGGLPMMVTYSDLIQIGILIVGICNLFLQVRKKK